MTKPGLVCWPSPVSLGLAWSERAWAGLTWPELVWASLSWPGIELAWEPPNEALDAPGRSK